MSDSLRLSFGWWVASVEQWWAYVGGRMSDIIKPENDGSASHKVAVIVSMKTQEGLKQRTFDSDSEWVYIGAQPTPKFTGEFLVRKFHDGQVTKEVATFNVERGTWLCFDQERITHWMPVPRCPYSWESKLTPN